jgi:CrcB protein
VSPWWHLGAAAGGGAIGAALRYGVNELCVRRGWLGLPLATFVVNVVGCFLAGVLLVWLDTRGPSAPAWRSFLMVGVLGGLTTFSALGVELWQFLRASRYDLLFGVVLAHVLLGILAVAAGWRLGRAIWP